MATSTAGSSTVAELAEIIVPLLPDRCYGVSCGGDEFVLVMPGLDRTEGGRLMEMIRVSIEQASFLTFCELNVHITVSSGIATYPGVMPGPLKNCWVTPTMPRFRPNAWGRIGASVFPR
ncbi:MAG: diguanylate cyclase [Proteobacteria bacterium]|nr:diguanylate cyclase [Pseudomonadota bacterium]